MDRVIQAAIVAMSGFIGVALTTWWLDRLIKRTTSAFKARTEEHDKQLMVMNVDLQLARSEVSLLQSELAAIRAAVDRAIDAPPSMRRPPAKPS